MRLLFIRHGDPDYVNDTLTEKGWEEAAALAELAPSLALGDCYVSPLGRAADTAREALRKTGKTAVTLHWLQEFMTDYNVNGSPELQRIFPDLLTPGEYGIGKFPTIGSFVNPHSLDAFGPDKDGRLPRYGPHVPWDMMPEYYTAHPELSDPRDWRSSFIAESGGMMPEDPARPGEAPVSTLLACYDYVTAEFDRFLLEYGYRRAEGGLYLTDRGHDRTVTFFCHFGITAVLLSRLWDCSPFLLQQSLCMAPTSVTEVVTEERAEGRAYFRALRIGDTTHLTMAGQKASFAARFQEVFPADPE